MSDLGFDTLGSQTPIVPVLVGQDEVAIQVWRGLWDGGVFTTPAIAPAIPPGQAIIRTSVNANHTEDQIDRVLGTFEVVGRRYGLI